MLSAVTGYHVSRRIAATLDAIPSSVCQSWKATPYRPTTEMTIISRLGRDDWEVQVTARQRISADARIFYLEADIEVSENGETLFERSWTPEIPRDHV